MFCEQCGKPMANDAVFCTYCGAKNEASNETVVKPRPIPPFQPDEEKKPEPKPIPPFQPDEETKPEPKPIPPFQPSEGIKPEAQAQPTPQQVQRPEAQQRPEVQQRPEPQQRPDHSNYVDLNQPLSVLGYIGTMIVFAIPIVGLIMMFVWAFGSNVNKNRKNFAIAALIMGVVAIILSIVFAGALTFLFSTLFGDMTYY